MSNYDWSESLDNLGESTDGVQTNLNVPNGTKPSRLISNSNYDDDRGYRSGPEQLSHRALEDGHELRIPKERIMSASPNPSI